VRRRLGICLLIGALALPAACASDAVQRTDERYCATVQQHLTELNAPSIATSSDVDRTVALYRSIAKVAPLAVEQEWDVLSLAYATAATVVPSDQASVQKAADTIRAAQQSATAIATYTQQRCNAQIGPAVVPTTLLSASTATDPNATTTSGETSGATTTTATGPP
jgi:hypothetical protein